MKRVYRLDAEGFYLEDVILENGVAIPGDCVDMPEPIGFYKIKYDRIKKKWVEGLTQNEIDEIRNQPIPKTEAELLKERLTLSEEAIDFLIMNGGL
ncbi:hypothetical protein AB1282_00210 [Gottfriedia sp. S16(2024)]|uniref:hypothetical protein n=1 Tax=Gottfriedia sp. S16(2024) TaxID=3162883 RepID=UPI003D25B922